MEIHCIEENKFRVIDEGHESIMTFDEVMFALSQPVESKKYIGYDAHEDFWREE